MLAVAVCSAALLGRLAIITGGTRGVGRGIADAMAQKGFNLLLSYNTDHASALRAKRELQERFGVSVACEGGDLCRQGAVDALLGRADRLNDTVGVVVHAAGQYLGVTSSNHLDLPSTTAGFGDGQKTGGGERTRAMRYYQTLYGSVFVELCEGAIERMAEGGGSIVGVSSPACAPHYNPNLGYDLPGSGKCVMEYAVRIVALRCASKRINVNVVVPGVTRTSAWDRLAGQRGMRGGREFVDSLALRIAPMGPMEPRELGECVELLCRPSARWITGLVVPMDGGVHLKI